MFEFLLYSGIHCTDAKEMVQRIGENKSVNAIIRTEVVVTIKEATPECKWDAND